MALNLADRTATLVQIKPSWCRPSQCQVCLQHLCFSLSVVERSKAKEKPIFYGPFHRNPLQISTGKI